MDIRIKNLFNIWFDFKCKVLEFDVLYQDSIEVDKLRGETIPDFFNNLNELYWNYFLITIARFLDNNIQGKNTNLTLFTLSEILKENGKGEWREIKTRVDELKLKFKDITDYRRKHLAHFDLDYSIGEKEFNSSIHIDEVTYFLNETLSLINRTLIVLGFEEESGVVINSARYYGSRELLRILKKEQNCHSRLAEKRNDI